MRDGDTATVLMTLPISRKTHATDPQPGVTVAQVQRHLIRRGFTVGPYGPDGRFGDASERATLRFQAHRGITEDGIIGEQTWGLLSRSFPKPVLGGRLTQAQRFARICAQRFTGADGHPRMTYQFGYEITNLSTRYPQRGDCLPADTMVNTATGPRPIIDVHVGDLVWAWEDSHLVQRPVTAFLEQGFQQTYMIRTGNRAIRATAGHRLLRVSHGGRPRAAGNRYGEVNWQAEWVRVDQLSRGDFIVALDHLDDDAEEDAYLPDGTRIDEDVAWLLGLITGDGSLTGQNFRICVYGTTRMRARQILERVWGLTEHDESDRNGLHVRGAQRLKQALSLMGMNCLGPKKYVPELIKVLPAKLIRAYCDGYAAADGHVDKRGYLAYHSASRRLVADVRALHIALGDQVSNLSLVRRTRPIVIKGKTVKNALPLHSFQVYPGPSTKAGTRLGIYGMRRALPDARTTISKIRSISEATVEPTYDLTVEGAHSFIAEGLVSHNCSEGMQWGIYQITGDDWVDGSWNQYAHGHHISVATARRTPGALVFLGPSPGAIYHVGVVIMRHGKPHVAQARSAYLTPNCGVWPFDDQPWSYAAKVPILHYG